MLTFSMWDVFFRKIIFCVLKAVFITLHEPGCSSVIADVW